MNYGNRGCLAGHLVISPHKYEIKCQWQSWTCSLQGESVLICSARPLCLSHCHCQLCNVADWSDPLSSCKLHCLLPMLYSPITLGCYSFSVLQSTSVSYHLWRSPDHHTHLYTCSKLPCRLPSIFTCFLQDHLQCCSMPALALHPFCPVILFMTHWPTFWTSFLPVFPTCCQSLLLKNYLK